MLFSCCRGKCAGQTPPPKVRAGMGLSEAVCFGIAAGAAALMGLGTELCRRSAVGRLFQVTLVPRPSVATPRRGNSFDQPPRIALAKLSHGAITAPPSLLVAIRLSARFAQRAGPRQEKFADSVIAPVHLPFSPFHTAGRSSTRVVRRVALRSMPRLIIPRVPR
jgi:hypothetical protein